MATYPIAVRKKSMLHRQGTKEYHQVLVVNGDGKAMLIQRWGKKGADGQLQVDVFADSNKAVSEFDSKDREKRGAKSGYQHDPKRDTIVEAKDEAEFRRLLGPLYFFKAGANNLDFIVPGIETKGVEEKARPEFDRDGRIVRKGYEPKHTFTDFVEPAKPTVEQQVAENENWGLW